ncbi:protocadherin gamma subfamily A, 3 L homeolog isoform X2 [Xenopus laevis]|uniref:Protocadherin gamma subfamily A, 3 L homeolog isoform X2 n=1 Tax=Xenopus laevis TaxID=8355 RepID=A0A8J1MH26_XENLA|nr:protocadherin gamma subfamily A, 3 L homeolog isoform X2 [Xenopus laevis]
MITGLSPHAAVFHIMDIQHPLKSWKWQVIVLSFLCSLGWVSGQLRYSLAEELEPGTFTANVAEDLAINVAGILKRRMRLGSEGGSKYFALNQRNGELTINEKIDRETLCGSGTNCILPLEVILENPLELFRLRVEILDINDNSPSFFTSDQKITISEIFANPGTRFPIESAHDPDISTNGVSKYTLTPNPYFSLSVNTKTDGTLVPELIIEKNLDREEKESHKLSITAFDGGNPPRSGTSQITVIVLDSNDNAPVFDHSTYKVVLEENTPQNTVILKLNATDQDEGLNGEIEYFFGYHTLNFIKELFTLNQQSGEISVHGVIDFEEKDFYEISVRAKDKGNPEHESRCLILIRIEDVNDNAPEITLTSLLNAVPENAALGTAVGFLSVRDKDSGKNGVVHLEMTPNLPFKVKSFDDHYSIITDGVLDREAVSQYFIDLIATDLGSPPQRTKISIILNISDINDNPPAFSQSHFSAFIKENNDPGSFLCTVSAEDPDDGLNSVLTYSIVEKLTDDSSILSFVYIDSNNGNIYAQGSFDYEQIQVLQVTVKAEDDGSPRLSSNITVFIFILDQNDNAPVVLYPEHSKQANFHQNVPKSASPGFLVTKVSAVDLDSGHNAWLSYHIIEQTDLSLFQISSSNGEIRTVRELQEIEWTDQKLVISVNDHGEHTLSTTVTIFISLEESIFEESPKSKSSVTQSGNKSDVTLYLIISLVAVSVVSFMTFIILLARCLKKETNSTMCSCCLGNPELSYYSEQCRPTLHLNTDGTLKFMEVRMEPSDPQGQCYKTCFSPSEINEFSYLRPLHFPQLQTMVHESEGQTSNINGFTGTLQAQPNADWRFSQAAQKPGPSGTQPTEEAGVWPNNQFETERLQAMILASANEAAEGTSGLGGGTGTMGLSARYGPQFTLQHVPDYRQNVYIPGSTLTPTNGGGKREGKGNKKKSSKKDKK